MLNAGDLNPLHVAIQTCCFENAVLLFKESQEHCPETLKPNQEGEGYTSYNLLPINSVSTLGFGRV